jgi:mono/diheme cytochrome c family protein
MKTLIVRIAMVLGALLALAGAAAAVLVAVASHRIGRRWEVPTPAVVADRAPAAVARGAALFRTECLGCHAGPDGRPSGRHMDDLPPFLGVIRSANLTAHPTAGVGGLRDQELARVIRNGVLPDGHHTMVMPTYPGMSDADLSAILGFMRSGDPLFAPEARPQERPAPSVIGKALLAFVYGVEPVGGAGVVAAPARGPDAAYGAYLANEVFHCAGCHTAGFSGDKRSDPKAYAGGFELRDAGGRPVFSPNVTPDAETGLGRWSQEDLVRALRDGVRPDGTGVGQPMLRLRLLGEDEVQAIAAYLRTVPAVKNAVPRAAPVAVAAGGGAAAGEPHAEAGAALFTRYGCVSCHGPGRPFRERLRPAADQPLDEVTARILHPERFNPSSPMPTFAGTIDEATARQLAAHVKELVEQLSGPKGTTLGVNAVPGRGP